MGSGTYSDCNYRLGDLCSSERILLLDDRLKQDRESSEADVLWVKGGASEEDRR